MVLLEAAVVVGVVGLVVYLAIVVLMRPKGSTPVVDGAIWRVAHYEVVGATRVVVRRVSPGGVNILDEHVVDTVPVDDPDYDQKFLVAMSAARERLALFESEENPT